MYHLRAWGVIDQFSFENSIILIIKRCCISILSTDTEDYIAFQFVPLTFNAGTVSGTDECYTITIVNDNVLENNETFSVTLSSNEPAFSLVQATVTINHDPADCEFVRIMLLTQTHTPKSLYIFNKILQIVYYTGQPCC